MCIGHLLLTVIMPTKKRLPTELFCSSMVFVRSWRFSGSISADDSAYGEMLQEELK